jgi:hypothetical protein
MNAILNVNVTNATLNVNIASQTTTLNVTISGYANVIISGQVVGISVLGTYQTWVGREFTAIGGYVGGAIPAGAQGITIIDVINNTGYPVMIEGFSVIARPTFDTHIFVGKLFAELIIDDVNMGAVTLTNEKMSESFVLLRAVRVAPNSRIKVVVSNFGVTPVYPRGIVYGYY